MSAGLQAMLRAQQIAFAPFAFQAARIMRDHGLLKSLASGRRGGRSTAELVEASGLSEYAVETLCEAGLAFGLVRQADKGWGITRTGLMIERGEVDKRDRVASTVWVAAFAVALVGVDWSAFQWRSTGLQVDGDALGSNLAGGIGGATLAGPGLG